MLERSTKWILCFCLFFGSIHHAVSQGRIRANQGQWSSQIAGNIALSFGDIWIEEDGLVFVFYDNLGHETISALEGHQFTMRFIDSDTPDDITWTNAGPMPTRYFTSSTHSTGGSVAYDYEQVTLHNIYPNIDFVFDGKASILKYSFIVHPGGDPSIIKMAIDGIIPQQNQNGLVFTTSAATMIEESPIAFQTINGNEQKIPCSFVLSQDTLEYNLAAFDHNAPLIIDPTLIFSTYTGSQRDNFGFTATYDNNGNGYAGGMLLNTQNAGGEYPTTSGIFNSYQGNVDIGITRFDANGANILYSLIIGGSDGDLPNSMITNDAGELYVLGTTGSSDFPMCPSAQQCGFDTTFNNPIGSPAANFTSGNGILFTQGSDMVVFKIDATGSAMLSSTFIGGSGNDGLNDDNDNVANIQYNGTDLHYNYGDAFRGEIILDSADNVFITSSTNSLDFPLAGNGVATTLGGEQDAVLLSLSNDLTSIRHSRYIGGSDDDGGYSLKLNGSGQVYVTGGTKSADFPTTNTTIQPSFAGITDGYLGMFDAGDGTQGNTTFLGTSVYDQSYLVEVDRDGDVYVTGQSEGNYPTANAPYIEAGGNHFIHKISPDLTTTIYSTVFGPGNGQVKLSPTAFLVDKCERVYVSGWGGLVNNNRNANVGTTTGFVVTPDQFNPNPEDGSDFYFTVFDRDMTGHLFGSYFGGNGSTEHVDGGTSRFDDNGVIYQAVCADCGTGGSLFPSTTGAYAENNGMAPSFRCNTALLKVDVGIPQPEVVVEAFPRATGCLPLTVQFSDSALNVQELIWDFGDGSPPFTGPNPLHTYTDTGIFTVTLLGIDTTVCDITDTATLQVEVGDDSISADFDDVLTVLCDSNQVILRAPFVLPTTQYNWNLGDGTTSTDSLVVHSYLGPGTYSVSLTLLDSNSCSLEDSFTTNVTIPTSPLASINLLDTIGCAPITINFANSSTNFSDVLWDFGTGDSSIQLNPTYTFQDSGSFEVQLIAYDSSGCIPSDTATATVQTRIDRFTALAQIDTLQFDCDELQIQGSSLNSGVEYLWVWGNGSTSSDSSATTLYGPGSYTALYIGSDPTLPCGRPDTLIYQFMVRPKIEAEFNIEPVCDSQAIQPTLTSGFFNAIEWRFGDGTISNLENPSHIYGGPGVYEVIVTLTDSASCNIQASDTSIVEVYNNPRADFSLDSTTIQYGSLVTLTNLSQNYDGLLWNLGDGTLIDDEEVIEHLYETFGEIQPCLQAVIDGLPCADTLCKSIAIEVNPLLGMPNAFTPNGDGLNDTAFVEGRHIADLSYRIYNRWGELVFESDDLNKGWDGRFRGVLQEQEVYVYVVEARFIDNSRQVLRGNLTLIR